MVLTVISHSICLASNLWKMYFTIAGKICCTACGHKPTAAAQELLDQRPCDQFLTFIRYCPWDPIHSHSDFACPTHDFNFRQIKYTTKYLHPLRFRAVLFFILCILHRYFTYLHGILFMSEKSPYSCTDQQSFLFKLLLFLPENLILLTKGVFLHLILHDCSFSLYCLRIRSMALASCRKDFFVCSVGLRKGWVMVVMVSLWKTIWILQFPSRQSSGAAF